jgi:HAD superfamily phosphatase (TIGR01668 family)
MRRSLGSLFQAYRRYFNHLITPSEIATSLDKVDFDALYHNGYRHIIFDVDNTLITPEATTLSLQMENTLRTIESKGYTIFLVSNNSSRQRIKRVADHLNVEAYFFSIKPFTPTAYDIQNRFNVNLNKTIVIGDQLLTDIIFSNLIGAYGIFVEPLNKNLSFIKTLQRELELKLIRWLA